MIDWLVYLLSWGALLAGGFFCLVGAVGLLRLPDFFSRVHGAGVLDSLGAGLILLGLILQAGLGLNAVKLGLILVFMLITGPTAVHALAQAALHGGAKPVTDEDSDANAGDTSSRP